MDARNAMNLRGADVFTGFLDLTEQRRIVDDVRNVVKNAPLFSPVTPSGKKMSVQMTSAGRFGWVSDKSGYRYSETHPSGGAWPDIPESVSSLWRVLLPEARKPECCLINFYSEGAKMGMHVDRDEADFSQPVLSISLGDEALFRVGNHERGGKTESLWLKSGDVVVLRGEARLKYHGIDRIKFGTSTLLSQGGRLNLTLRCVT